MNTQSAINTINQGLDSFVSDVDFITRLTTITQKLVVRIKLMKQVQVERKLLSTMSPERLRDIGVEVGAANQEAARSYFDYPLGR